MKKLNNYLHTYRRRTALSQKDVARLLGSDRGGRISRYEHGRRLPELLTAPAFEVLLGVPLRELFAGLYDQVEQELRGRARELARNLSTPMRQMGVGY